MSKIKKGLILLKNTGIAFNEDNAFKLSASLSYYTIFALGPLFIIIISLAGLFFGQDAVEGKIYEQTKTLVGNNAALQIQDIIKNASHSHATTAGAVIGIIILFIGA